mmetsp:Transcript_24923/g.53092  ORF Transcript_24923/g.53092 Transcript_24923/m.53092 type:complete len:252 (+) Transcript_24923:101-856(+)|eukprot:CAMPEP_0201229010 /NCGR_PEP_ID=MMETSP0852-20130820/594_1 /ASSEMBLY_ACC=CAM_ASM_000632 /TAXON_ID=183588 /ORGANISM="Pseudo-nitzschia fraudulenta, Strain WWA7" /LENGTH=251 /DNA_ID=CAMNT_0047519137 /DNA_START=86 /DNA_END=841 /DNA_ORIENTATION=-
MLSFRTTTVLGLAIACGFKTNTSRALTATSLYRKSGVTALIGSKGTASRCPRNIHLSKRPLVVLGSSPDPNWSPDEMEGNDDVGADASMASNQQQQRQQQPETPPAYVPPPPSPTRNSQAAIRQKSMDPLMASLTRDSSNPSADQPTRTVPIFGEIPADGTLLLLAPAVVFAVLGFIYSIVIAVNSTDQIVDSLSQAGGSLAQTAVERSNRSYDENVCRGLCSNQQDDIDGLKNFMEAITRNARENQQNQQ